jgi:DNA-binding Lrp family transcriptional regulator
LQRPTSSSDDTNTRTAQLVKLISEIGPDIPEISRRLGQFKESVRYRYKEKLLDKGLAVQAMVDYEKLGLRRLELIVDFAPEFRRYSQTIMVAMSELCYVVSFMKMFPRGTYVMAASVPAEYVDDFAKLMDILYQKGLFSDVRIHYFDWFRNMPMQAQFYDFDSGRWEYDWSKKADVNPAQFSLDNPAPARFDYVDLLILKELQADATRSMVEVSSKVRVNYKVLAWHLATHIVPRGLVRGYVVRWPGTRYDYKVDKALQRQHRYSWVDVMATGLTKPESMQLASRMSALPFVWSQAGGRDYFAELVLPVDFLTEALQRVQEILLPVRDRAELYMMDQTDALGFSIGYKLFDQDTKKWSFNSKEMEGRFGEMILKIKTESQT